VGGVEDAVLRERRARELQADGQAVRQPARQGDGGMPARDMGTVK
jgi:hypothetical protein